MSCRGGGGGEGGVNGCAYGCVGGLGAGRLQGSLAANQRDARAWLRVGRQRSCTPQHHRPSTPPAPSDRGARWLRSAAGRGRAAPTSNFSFSFPLLFPLSFPPFSHLVERGELVGGGHRRSALAKRGRRHVGLARGMHHSQVGEQLLGQRGGRRQLERLQGAAQRSAAWSAHT